MANKIITKNSSTAGAVPTAVDLVTGELAVNVTDKRLFTENAGGTIVELGTNPSSLTVNEAGADVDFRVESDTNTHALFLEGSSGNVGIGTSSPSRTLHVDAGSSDIVALFESSDSPASISFYDGTGGTNINSSGNEIYFRTGSTATGSGGNERVRINSNGAVLVGGTNAASAHGLDDIGSLFLQSQTNNANIGLSIYVNEGANNRRASFFVDDSLGVYGVESTATTGVPDFVIRRSGNEFARFTADGLTFNGDTAAANALDDYEEGTWTPVLSDATTGGNTSPTTATSATYTKVGRLVTVQCSFIDVNKSGMTAGNDLIIQGFPFTALSVAGTTYIPGSVVMTNTTFTGSLNSSIVDNNTYGRFNSVPSGGSLDHVMVSEISNGTTDIYLSLTYSAA